MYYEFQVLHAQYDLLSRSKLGALFGMDKAGNQGGNESLTYTAPKQPKKKGMLVCMHI